MTGYEHPPRHPSRPRLGRAVVWILSLLLACSGALVATVPTYASGTDSVTTCSGDPTIQGSLPYEVANAVSGDTIQFTVDCPDPNSPVVLNSSIDINLPTLTIDGGGHQVVLTDFGDPTIYYLFDVHDGAALTLHDLSLEDAKGDVHNDQQGRVTISNSIVANYGGPSGSTGGAIANYGGLTVTNSTFSHNFSADQGAAISNDGGTVNITASTFSNNFAPFSGGAIWSNGGTVNIAGSALSNNAAKAYYGGAIDNEAGTLELTHSTLSGNTAEDGGAIYNGGTLLLANSTLSGNTARQDGGAIANGANVSGRGGGTVTITNTTLSENSVDGGGGGAIVNVGGTLTVTDSTLSGNSAPLTTNGGGSGGAIASSGKLTVESSTFSSNSTGQVGGAIDVGGGSATIGNSTLTGNGAVQGGAILGGDVTLGGSIVADNTALANPNCYLPNGHDDGYNLSTDGDCLKGAAGDRLVPDAGLDPNGLADNGGPTQTIALQPSSPAADQIPTSFDIPGTSTPLCPATDQRGVTRPDDGEQACDIGAFESHGFDPCPTSESALASDISTAATSTVPLSCTTPTTVTFGSPISISRSLTLDASGSPGAITFDGGGTTQLFQVQGGALALNDLTLTHGYAAAGTTGGAVESMNGTVTLSNTTLSANSGQFGGAIGMLGGTLNISSSTVADNFASESGGAIFNAPKGSFGTTYSAGTVAITNSTLSANTTGSTIDNPNSPPAGGAIYNGGGTLTVGNTTFSSDSAIIGGAIFSYGSATVTTSTFSGNSAPSGGAVIYNDGTASLAGNITASGPSGENCYGGGIHDQGYNLDTDGSCLNGGTGDIRGQDPKLDPNGLQSNGGPTKTIALEPGSPAIDRIPTSDASLCPTSGTDQRGYPRPDDGESVCDIGAYESEYFGVGITSQPPSLSNSSSASFAFSAAHGSGTVTYTCTLDGGTATSCTSPQSYSNLASGTHTFTVTATDQAGNSASASYTWTVDTSPPVISITSPAANAAYPLDQAGHSFTFSCSDPYDGVSSCTGSLTGTGISGSTAVKSGDAIPTSAAGSFTLTVKATDQIGNSNQQQVSYTVTNPAPSTSSLSPVSATAGSTGLTLKVHGANFVYSVSQVDWNGSALSGGTYYSKGTQVTSTGGLADEIDVTVPSSDLASTGPVSITVVNPAPGGGASNPQTFYVTPANVSVTASNSATSTSTSGTATATVGGTGSGTSGSVTAAGSGQGTVAVAQYSASPETSAPPTPVNAYFDVYVPSGSSFTSVTITDCNLAGGSALYYWTGSAWQQVAGQKYSAGPPACVTAAITNPSILSGTPFAVSDQPPTLTLPGSLLVQQKVAASLQVSATDPEGDNTVTLSASGLPAGLSLGSTTCTGGVCSATISGSATATVGSYSATITATEQDASAASAKQALTVSVDTNLSGYPKLSSGAYNLQNATLKSAYLVTFNLAGANGTNATLSSANLSGANLSSANLTQANLTGANLSNTNLTNANLSQANLKGATGMSTASLTGVTWSNTTCPDGTVSANDGGTCLGHL